MILDLALRAWSDLDGELMMSSRASGGRSHGVRLIVKRTLSCDSTSQTREE